MDRATDALLAAPIRFSHLRAYGRSAAHGLHARTTERKPTAAMELGTAVHAMLFGTQSVTGFDGPRRGKAFEEFRAQAGDALVLGAADYIKALGMVESLKASPLAMRVLDGEAEQTLRFRWFGRDCRSTPDVRGKGWVTDLKTSTSSDPARFVWHALRMKYHAQLRMQQIAYREAGHGEAEQAYIVAVEVDPPHAVTVFDITARALQEGEKLLTLWMERLLASEAAREWPGYCEALVPLDVPEDLELDYGGDDD